MSRPNNYWYSIAQKMTKRYQSLKYDNSKQSIIFKEAIDECINETLALSNGEEQIGAVNAVLFMQSDTVSQYAMRNYYSQFTVRKWINRFVNEVGKKAGF